MNTPLVSIMMPVYNGYPLIKASVESIKRQTYENWECIIIDDGSTDETPEYLDSINDPRFVIVHQPNGGRPVARQRALDLAKGKYIGMLDAEDLFHPEKIAHQVRILEERPKIVAVTTSMCSFGTQTDNLYVRGSLSETEEVYVGNNPPAHAPSLLRADIAKRCKYNPILKLGEDQDFLEKYLNVGDTFILLPNVYYYYSELDSVSKKKMRKNYYLYISKYIKEKNYKMSMIFLLKYIYSLVIFPFISIDSILAKRGRPCVDKDLDDYKQYCLTLVKEINNL